MCRNVSESGQYRADAVIIGSIPTRFWHTAACLPEMYHHGNVLQLDYQPSQSFQNMTAWHGDVFRIACPLWGEPTVSDRFHIQRGSVMRNFDVFFALSWTRCSTNIRFDFLLRPHAFTIKRVLWHPKATATQMFYQQLGQVNNKETSNLRLITDDLLMGINRTGGFPLRRACDAESVMMWCHRHQHWSDTLHDDVIKWKKIPRSSDGKNFRLTGPLWGESTGHRWIPLTKASDAELWCFLWSAPEQTTEQTVETPVIWDAVALIMTSLWYENQGLSWQRCRSTCRSIHETVSLV